MDTPIPERTAGASEGKAVNIVNRETGWKPHCLYFEESAKTAGMDASRGLSSGHIGTTLP